ncbi:RNA binding motif protein 3 [Mycena pura]|uniref:RNA binding motif protein 3 n=1 Tax=Mycena pura TaxID=153505 RepID=A0AAD6V9V9_9AGAR|nr:RNA binding motif protein 3 [Mycena pura]
MGSKLYVGNLSWNTDDEALSTAFSQWGEAICMKDRETGRARGFGFVTFAKAEDAQAAIDNMNGTELDGRTLRVNIAGERGGGGGRGGYGGGGGGGGYGGGYGGHGGRSGGRGGYGGGGGDGEGEGGEGGHSSGGYGGGGYGGGGYGGGGYLVNSTPNPVRTSTPVASVKFLIACPLVYLSACRVSSS